VYLGEDALGASRSFIGEVSIADDASYLVPPGLEFGNFSHMLVYARSSLGEQTTPAYQTLWNDFEAICGSVAGLDCATSAGEGQGSCSPANMCSECGLTAARIQTVEDAVNKGAISIIGSESDYGTHAAMGAMYQCGLFDFTVTYYTTAPVDTYQDPAAPPPPPPTLICRYSCLPDGSTCRLCRPPTDAADPAEPDVDGSSVWKYLACKYRGIDEPSGDDLQFAYVFSNGDFIGLGTEVQDTMSCAEVSIATFEKKLFDLSALACDAPGGACSLEILAG